MRFIAIFLIISLFTPYCYASENANFNEKQKQYTFEDDTMSGKVVKIKKGTTLPVILLTEIDTSTVQENDEVQAMLNEDLNVEGITVAPKGSFLYGKVTKAKCGSGGMRGGKVKINFYEIKTLDKQTFNITTKAMKNVVSEGDMLLRAGKVLLGIVEVAAYVVLTGGGAIVVAAILGAAGVATFLSTKGPDALIPVSTPAEVSLNSSVKVMATY